MKNMLLSFDSEQLHKEFKIQCAKEEKTMKKVIMMLIIQWLESKK